MIAVQVVKGYSYCLYLSSNELNILLKKKSWLWAVLLKEGESIIRLRLKVWGRKLLEYKQTYSFESVKAFLGLSICLWATDVHLHRAFLCLEPLHLVLSKRTHRLGFTVFSKPSSSVRHSRLTIFPTITLSARTLKLIVRSRVRRVWNCSENHLQVFLQHLSS